MPLCTWNLYCTPQLGWRRVLVSFFDQSLCQNEMSTSLGWKMENIVLTLHPQFLEDSTVLPLVPWELLEAFFPLGWLWLAITRGWGMVWSGCWCFFFWHPKKHSTIEVKNLELLKKRLFCSLSILGLSVSLFLSLYIYGREQNQTNFYRWSIYTNEFLQFMQYWLMRWLSIPMWPLMMVCVTSLIRCYSKS